MAERSVLPEVFLDVIDPGGGRRSVKMAKSPFRIGRGQEAGNDLQLPDKRISRNCAAVVFTDSGFRLDDLGQRHGLFVNGEKIARRMLQDGDHISFGLADSYSVVFRQEGATPTGVDQILSRLESSRDLDPGTRDLRRLSLLLETTALLQSRLPIEEILTQVVDHAVEVTGADRGVLLEASPEGELAPALARQRGGKPLAPQSVRFSQNAITQALKDQKSLVVEDMAQAALREARSVVEQELRSVVAIPLLSFSQLRGADTTYVPKEEDLLGLLYLDSRRPVAFSQLDRRILDALATEAANVLDNARLVEREMDRRKMEQELAVAREIQQALLPRQFKQYPHFQVTGTNRTCLAVGGDYFDLMELDSELTAFVVADVCGKGLGAALVMTMLQGTFSAMTLGQEPTQVFSHINRFICQHSEVHRYATLFFAMLDTRGSLTYLNAGHLPPLLVRKGSVEMAMQAESLPLGLVPDAEYVARSLPLQPGDTVVLYTDGITEAINPQEEEFGLERLQEATAKHVHDSVEDMQEGILEEVESFTAGAYQADDITLLIVRYLG